MLAQFYYNVDGIRTRKVVDGTAINYLVDANQPYSQVIAETNDMGQALKTYLYGDDLISQTDANNRTHSFHYDGLGSTRMLSDDSGNVSDQYSYAAFGELLSSIGDTDNNYLFTGEQYDDSVDNYYLRARYYNPEIGRFTRQDEWLGRNNQPVTLNKYLYTHADPVNGTDPSGYMTLASLSVSQTGFSSLAAVGVANYGKRVIVAALFAHVYYLYSDISNGALYFDLERSETRTPAEEEAAQREYEFAKDFCDNKQPKESGNSCSDLSKWIDHAEMCVNLYEEWDRKWNPGRHADNKLQQWKNRIKRLKADHNKRCT